MHMLDANKLGALGTMIADRLDGAFDGLSPSAAALLSMLYFKPNLTVTQLATIVGVRQPTAVRVLDGLVTQGLVVRGDPIGRITPLSLTAKGRKRAAALQHHRLAALDDLLHVLKPGERRQFDAMLDRILAGATTSRAFARTTCRLCEHELCGPAVCPIGARATELELQNQPAGRTRRQGQIR